MHIDIALRCKPFSHEPGTVCLIPGTDWRVRVFPTLIHFFGPEGQRHTEHFPIEGPIEGFTIEQDLEQKKLRVFGRAKLGYQRYEIRCVQDIIDMVIEKPEKKIIRIASSPTMALPKERLSLGMHKLQHWEEMRRRLDLREILPLWFRLGLMTPSASQQTNTQKQGSLGLFEECLALYETKEKKALEIRLRHLMMAGFGGMMNPRLCDPDHQGILSDDPEEDHKRSLKLLQGGAELIRSLFFLEKQNTWHLLPCLLPRFDAGRLTQVETRSGDLLDLEWSKSTMRRMIIHPKIDHSIEIVLPKELRRCRLRHRIQEKGRSIQTGETIQLSADKAVFLDRFEK
ncbi:MAG: hypothetical protein KGZ39_05955 [Simkania sp.]|nr:hypothetical protein [Simkania sp.]